MTTNVNVIEVLQKELQTKEEEAASLRSAIAILKGTSPSLNGTSPVTRNVIKQRKPVVALVNDSEPTRKYSKKRRFGVDIMELISENGQGALFTRADINGLLRKFYSEYIVEKNRSKITSAILNLVYNGKLSVQGEGDDKIYSITGKVRGKAGRPRKAESQRGKNFGGEITEILKASQVHKSKDELMEVLRTAHPDIFAYEKAVDRALWHLVYNRRVSVMNEGEEKRYRLIEQQVA